jgi:hypothetical protein
LGRCGTPFSEALASRYTINSSILVSLIYIALVELYGKYFKRIHFTLICLMALLFNIWSLLYAVPIMAERESRLTTGAQRYIATADKSGLVRKFPERAANDLVEAEKHNIYHLASGLGIKPPYKTPPVKILGVVQPTP